MTSKRNNIIALSGTIVVHILLIVFLIFFGYTAHIPHSEAGLTVHFGNIDLSAGTFEPRGEIVNQVPSAPSSPAQSVLPRADEEDLISQDDESIALEAAKKKQEEAIRQQQEEAARREAERIRQEQERKAAEIREQAAQAFGAKSGQESASQGFGQEAKGNQGDVQGSTESTFSGKSSGYGDFSLDGRSVSGGLPRPLYSIEAEGVVVVRITVNSAGAVIATEINLQGTDTDNIDLRKAAENAAKLAKFNAIDGTRIQTGTITYRFQLR